MRLAVILGRDDAVGVGHLGGDQVDHALVDVDVRERDALHADLCRQGAVDVGLLHVAQLDQQLPQRTALLLLVFEGLGDLRAGHLAHLDQDAPQGATLQLRDRGHIVVGHAELRTVANS
jgi:hypothetical protein